MRRGLLICFLLLGQTIPSLRAQGFPGSRYGICETCGKPTVLGQDTCFHCLRERATGGLLDWARRALDRSREALENLKDPNLTDQVVEKLLQVKRDWQEHLGRDREAEGEARRRALESLGQTPVGSDGRSVNDLAREAVNRYLPALEGTDFAADPARTLSYYLVLDGKGFIENVRFLKGPLGQPMTLLEAAEYYRGIDPRKSAEILRLLDDIRQLSSPDVGQDKIPALLDAVSRGLQILTE